MSPSNQTVVRFIALFCDGHRGPIDFLILGYGFQNEGGQSHRVLRNIYSYGNPVVSQSRCIYAGYLSLESKKVKVAVSGSYSLGIIKSEVLEKRVIDEIEAIPALKTSIQVLFPLITKGSVPHVMLSAQ